MLPTTADEAPGETAGAEPAGEHAAALPESEPAADRGPRASAATAAPRAAAPLPADEPALTIRADEPALTIRAAEAEAETLYVAGEAPPGTLVRIYADDEFVGEVEASDQGTWLIEANRKIPLGEVVIRADAIEKEGRSVAGRTELPFVRHADGVVLEPVATADGTGASATGLIPEPVYVIIRRGDNLWRISRRNYGRGIRYEAIVAANRNLIRNPDLIYPGQVFVMPTRDRKWETAVN
jgi:nucleoid-associated protein YgaU